MLVEVKPKVVPQYIQFDMLSNARDSLRQAVELLAWKDFGSDDARLKHAITCAAHAVELLLKERLRKINPAFVWENVDKYPSLEARTVTVDTAILRLKNIGGVGFTDRDEKNLRSLRKTRNAIEHYEWTTTKIEAKIVIGNALSFAMSFALDHLGIDLTADFKKDDTWRMLVEELYTFASAHGARIQAKLEAKGDCPAPCDACGQATVPMGGGSCELCGHWQEVEEP
jgi:hypothetical protein